MVNRDEQIKDELEIILSGNIHTLNGVDCSKWCSCGACTTRKAALRILALLKEQPCKTCLGSKKCPVCKGTGADPKEGGLKMCWNCGGSSRCPDCQEKKYKKAGQEIPNRLKMKS